MTVERLHASPWQGVFFITGGGSLLLSNLLTKAGASNTVLEARVPYSEKALKQILAYRRANPVEQACSADTSDTLAVRAYLRAKQLGAQEPLGVGVTASLRSSVPKRGTHRAHVSTQTKSRSSRYYLELEKSLDRTRLEEEVIVADVILNAVLTHLELASDEQCLDIELAEGSDAESRFLNFPNKRGHIGDIGSALLPGAFNPLHRGHREMAQKASKLLGCKVQYELSVRNVDKPPLSYLQMRERIGQFDDGEVVLTNAPTFIQKSRLKEGLTFVVGVDTLVRIADLRYYPVRLRNYANFIAALEETRTRFLVFGRLQDGNFQTLDDLDIPAGLRNLCQAVPESDFRVDESSTALRGSSSTAKN